MFKIITTLLCRLRDAKSNTKIVYRVTVTAITTQLPDLFLVLQKAISKVSIFAQYGRFQIYIFLYHERLLAFHTSLSSRRFEIIAV